MPAEPDPRLNRLFPSMARSVLAAAPAEWSRAIYKVEATPGCSSTSLTYDTADGRIGRTADLDDEVVMTLINLVGEDDAGFDIELTVRPDGDYEAAVSIREDTGLVAKDRGYFSILDPGHRPPPYRGSEPDETEPRDPSEAGDPDEVGRLIREYLSRVYAIFGKRLRTDEERPDSPADIRRHLDALERRTGVTLPADLRAAYEQAWGLDYRAFYPWSWLPPDWLDGALTNMREVIGWWPGWKLGWKEVVCDASPPGAVRRVKCHPAWIPFCDGPDQSYLAVDMSPGPEGRPGQVILVGRSWGDGAEYVADSVTTLIRNQLAALDRGDFDADVQEMTLSLHGEQFEFGRAEAAREWRGQAADLARDDITPELQRMLIWQGKRVDLEMLRDAPMLRELLVHSTVCDLAPLRDLPLESLQLKTARTDLTPLAGHPTLRVIALETTLAEPIDLAPLRTMPAIDGLDLSKAGVTGLDAIAELDGLRYLALNPDQWRELHERIGGLHRLPPLAAAHIAPAPSDDVVRHEEAVEWAGRLPGGDRPQVLRYTGRAER